MTWMAWTVPTLIFFAGIAGLLLAMTLFELRVPTVLRKGWLPMATTRGDRLFVSLLLAAFFHLAHLGLSDAPLWWTSALSVVLAGLLLRWG